MLNYGENSEIKNHKIKKKSHLQTNFFKRDPIHMQKYVDTYTVHQV